eukprot:6532851-Pyramimonas_sp.AAC.1
MYRSSLDAREPQNPTKSEEYQGRGGGEEGVRKPQQADPPALHAIYVYIGCVESTLAIIGTGGP